MPASIKINPGYHHAFLILESMEKTWQHQSNYLGEILFYFLI